jgi:hypothetical protein
MIKVGYFDNAEIELSEDDYDASDLYAVAALEAFLALTPADRIRDSRHVYAYYRDYREWVGGEDWMDEEMGVPGAPEEIWTYVRPQTLGIWAGRNGDDNRYVFLEANCGWEHEHGLLLVWRNGTTLSKAGGFDGHATNADASADGRMKDVVYSALDPAYTTRLQES